MRTPVSFRRSPSSHLLIRLAVVLLLALGLAPAISSQPAAAAESALTINSHGCPYGTDVAALSIYDLAAACQGQPALDYTINGPNYAQQVSAGLYTATGLEPGTYYVTQGDYSANWGTPVAYCSVNDALGGDVTATTLVNVTANNQSPIELAVDGYNAFCDVFNAEQTPPVATQGEAEVYISKWICPEGYTSTDYNDLVQDCSTEHEGVTFTIKDFADDAMSDDTGGQPARASFNGWKTGGATITETIPQGYGQAVVYCYAQDDFGTVFPGYELANYPVNAGSISIDIPVDPNGGISSFFCDWYNFPADTGYTEDAEVYISKWECPAGYFSDDYDDLSSSCDRELEGIDFTITHESGESNSDDTGGQPARAAFTPWYNGFSTITESAPEGYGTPVVYCYATDDFGDDFPGYELRYYDVTDYSIDIEIPYDPNGIVSFYCDWYNTIDEPTYGGIYIHKYGCPQWYDDPSFQQLASSCWNTVHDAEFEVEGPGGYSDSQRPSGTDVAWENLEPGDYTVTEDLPSGYESSKVYCTYGAYEEDEVNPYEEEDASGDSVGGTLEGGYYIDCVWYNIPPRPTGGSTTRTPTTTQPAGPATLIIVKYTCEEDYDAYASKADPTEDCDETTDGVTFTLRGGRDSSLAKVTGEDDDPGTATFGNLPAGSYLLQETYPEGVSASFVWECASTVRGWVYAFAPFAVVGPDGITKINVVPGETLTCSWYDVPSGDEPEGTPTGGDDANVSVAVLDCPSDLISQASCDPAPAGVAVDLLGAGGAEDAELETDDDGVASGEVEPGGYDLEIDGDICFADSDAFDGDGLLNVDDEPVEVTIYRCDGE